MPSASFDCPFKEFRCWGLCFPSILTLATSAYSVIFTFVPLHLLHWELSLSPSFPRSTALSRLSSECFLTSLFLLQTPRVYSTYIGRLLVMKCCSCWDRGFPVKHGGGNTRACRWGSECCRKQVLCSHVLTRTALTHEEGTQGLWLECFSKPLTPDPLRGAPDKTKLE